MTVLQLVPSLLRALVEEPAFGDNPSLRLIFCGGEVLSRELVARCHEAVPNAALCNLYGPTETTVDVAYAIIDASSPEAPPSASPSPGRSSTSSTRP